jgi:hypothetical protein
MTLRRALAGSPFVRRVLRRGDLARLAALCTLVEHTGAPEEAGRRHLLASPSGPWQRWTAAALERRPLAELEPWFRIEGLELIERARAGGRGVLLVNAHRGAGLLVPALLARRGLELGTVQAAGLARSLAPEDARRLVRIEIDPRDPGAARRAAERALQSGAVLHFAPDGFFGRGGVELAFLGRRRTFRAGFAALALDTGAAVLPIDAPLDGTGRATVRIGDPLDPPAPGLARGVAISTWVERYVARVERLWRADPGNVFADHVRHVLALPAC